MENFSLPEWLAAMPESYEKECSITRFSIKLAALYATPEGSCTKFAELLNMNYHTLKNQIQRRQSMTYDTRKGIVKIVGRLFLPENMRR